MSMVGDGSISLLVKIKSVSFGATILKFLKNSLTRNFDCIK